MMNRCIDAGRDGCPCALAESGDCLLCSKINGGTCENCSWQGICIYTLYEQNGRRLVVNRQEQLLDIVQVRTYGPNFKVFVLRADRGFCQKAQTAGAYVFVKAEADDPWYGMPISILKSEPDKNLIHLGICACGPKTTHVFQVADQFEAAFSAKKSNAQAHPQSHGLTPKSEAPARLCVRGVYYNALSGQNALSSEPAETFIFGKGIAMAPLRNFLDGGERYTKYLKNLHIYVDLDKVGLDFFKDYFGELPAEAIEMRDFRKDGLCSLDDLDQLEAACSGARNESQESRRANVFALTSPYYADQIQRAAGPNATVVRPTEGNMCCGEGICGACTYNDMSGMTVRRCKISG